MIDRYLCMYICICVKKAISPVRKIQKIFLTKKFLIIHILWQKFIFCYLGQLMYGGTIYVKYIYIKNYAYICEVDDNSHLIYICMYIYIYIYYKSVSHH